MSSVSGSELAWSVIENQLEDLHASPRLSRSARVWIPQPDVSPTLFRVLAKLRAARVEVSHSFRPAVLALENEGFFSTTSSPTGPLDLVLFVPTRQRTESLALLAHALMQLGPDGLLIFACANTQGAGGYLTHLKEAFPDLEAESARKCRWVLVPRKLAPDTTVLEDWIRAAAPMRVPGSSFASVPGIYGWNKIDHASEILVSTLPDLAGHGADLGSGYGFLAHCALTKFSAMISRLDLVEADARALDCARENLAEWSQQAHFRWLDATAPETRTALKNLDWILMNPPFHEGSDVNQDVGRAFIESAATALRPGGMLYMVANTFLAYEKTLIGLFTKVDRVLERNGFKVIHARR